MLRLRETPLESLDLMTPLCNPRAGALVTFEGWVRNHHEGRAVQWLEYQAYEALADKEGRRIIQEALSRYEILAVQCAHRVGRVEIGQQAVWIGVTAEHRADAFQACRFLIDQIKQRLPIWKKETYVGGESAWVNCQHCGMGEHTHSITSNL